MTRPDPEGGAEASSRRVAGQGRVRAAQRRRRVEVDAAGRIADACDHIFEELAG